MEKKRIAVIGCGNRGNGVVKRLLEAAGEGLEIVSVFDPDPESVAICLENWQMPGARKAATYQEAIAAPGVDWVMVFSPNAFHCEHVTAAFAAGKNVFSEKPLATSIDDCQTMYDAWKKSGKLFATGFVLRYAPIYRKAKEILDSGTIGKLLSIAANENISPGHGGYIMSNWRRFKKFAGPHILEKCCHDLDLLIWFAGSLPARVAAFGGLQFFVPENQPLQERYGWECFNVARWRDAHGAKSPFTSDKDLLDTQVAIADFRNGVKINFQATMYNAIAERRMYFACTEGTMILDLYRMELAYRKLNEREIHQLPFGGADGHGGGDAQIMREFWESVRDNSTPKCGGSEGLESAVFAMALDQAMIEKQVIELEPVWRKLQR